MIRETKKSEIVSQMLHDRANNNVRQLNVIPGHNSFLTVPILNSSNQNEVYSVRISDPDQDIAGVSEMKLVSD